MHSINLLPWREWQKQKQLYHLLQMIISVLFIIIVIVVSFHRYLNHQLIQYQAMQQETLNNSTKQSSKLKEIDILKGKIATYEKSLNLIKQLKIKQNIPLVILDVLAEKIPSNTSINAIRYQNQVITLIGQAKDNKTIALFVEHLKTTAIFNDINLEEVTINSKALLDQQFKISMTLDYRIPDTSKKESHHALSS